MSSVLYSKDFLSPCGLVNQKSMSFFFLLQWLQGFKAHRRSVVNFGPEISQEPRQILVSWSLLSVISSPVYTRILSVHFIICHPLLGLCIRSEHDMTFQHLETDQSTDRSLDFENGAPEGTLTCKLHTETSLTLGSNPALLAVR